ncbi:protein of unknown function [Kyrpidia spormannii]|uniref:Uncharacterized protein n=1 Tax=Kyrpidia spormannii TaxID=2055160 RepID=A0ACA8ZA12_9BACL|nr:protein of unknown function [Kyrpidia spormannii]
MPRIHDTPPKKMTNLVKYMMKKLEFTAGNPRRYYIMGHAS